MKRQAILSLIEATAACARQVSVEDAEEMKRFARGDEVLLCRRFWTFREDLELWDRLRAKEDARS